MYGRPKAHGARGPISQMEDIWKRVMLFLVKTLHHALYGLGGCGEI